MTDKLIEIKDLKVSFMQNCYKVQVVRGVDISLRQGEIIGILGESGSGKTVSATSILRLEDESAILDSGRLFYKGEEITHLPEIEYRKLRGNRIAYIFQNASSALNPYKKIGKQLMEVLKNHNLPRSKERVLEVLNIVGIEDSETVYEMFPFQLSGGQNQRIMIAQAIVCGPDLLIADEPTSSVDASLRKIILNVLKDINLKSKMTIALITHDFEVAKYICDRLIIMYGGLIMEEGPMDAVFNEPFHPYSQALLKCARSIREDGSSIYTLEGAPPTPIEFTDACPFEARCDNRLPECTKRIPNMNIVGNRYVRCIHYRRELADVRDSI